MKKLNDVVIFNLSHVALNIGEEVSNDLIAIDVDVFSFSEHLEVPDSLIGSQRTQVWALQQVLFNFSQEPVLLF